ncbi:MAG: hypothetical protein ACR2PI_00365 [Hyphomicrobiaceae bacterium]
MSDPIIDKAQVSIDFPHKFYMGSFGRESRYDVTADKEGVHIHLDRPGEERRHVGFHLQHRTAAGVLHAMADALAEVEDIDADNAEALREACEYLAKSVQPK